MLSLFNRNEENYAAVYKRSSGATVYIDTSMAAKTPEERERVLDLIRKAVYRALEVKWEKTLEETLSSSSSKQIPS